MSLCCIYFGRRYRVSQISMQEDWHIYGKKEASFNEGNVYGEKKSSFDEGNVMPQSMRGLGGVEMGQVNPLAAATTKGDIGSGSVSEEVGRKNAFTCMQLHASSSYTRAR